MSYKNSVKLLTSNFSIVWKQLFYILIICLALSGITYGISIPVFDLLKQQGVTAEFASIFETIYTSPKDLVNTISNTMLHFSNVLSTNFSSIWFSILATTILAPLAYQLLKNISFYNISSLMHMQLSSYVEVGYTRNLISTLGESIRFSFAKLIYKLPFTLLRMVAIFTYFKIISSPILAFIGLFVLVLLLILLSAIEISIFSGMAPKMLETNGNISAFKAFFSGSIVVFKKFARVFSNAIIVVLTLVVINLFLGIFTLGVALLITVPASTLFVAIFQLVSYLNIKGERYYLSKTIIATPLKEDDENKKNNFQ